MEKVINFITENQRTYIYFLSKLKGFPFVCDYSSYILGAYLSTKFDIEPVYTEGDYEEDDNAHCWLSINDIIIDFTLSQFLVEKMSKKKVKSMSEEELYRYLITDMNIPTIIKDGDDLYCKFLTLGEYEIEDEFINCAKESSSFKEYLSAIKNKKKLLFNK